MQIYTVSMSASNIFSLFGERHGDITRSASACAACGVIKIASENPFLWTGMKDASAESRKMCYMKLHDYPKSCSRCL
jgi:hypothetical protein